MAEARLRLAPAAERPDGAPVPRPSPRPWVTDALLAALLMCVVIGYLSTLPLNLQSPDEARHLDHAKRILEGDVLYRDVFEITTPGWPLLMAAMFAIFGTTLATARMVAAVIHGLLAITLYAICRRLGVRRTLAWACGLAAVVVCQRVFPNASYHWLATLLCAVLLLHCLARTRAAWWAFVIGIDVGLLIAVHQQRGTAMGLGVAAVFAAQWALDRRQGSGAPFTRLVRQLVAAGAGIAAVMAPVLATMVARAGFAPVWECLVLTPLVSYRGSLRTWWGNTWGGFSGIIVVAKFVAFAIVPTAIVAVVTSWRRDPSEVARQHVVLTILGLASLLSIAYFPDIVHLSLVAAVFMVMVADLAERALRWLPARADVGLGAVIGAAVLVATGVRAYQNVVQMREMFPIRYDGAFGRIDLGAKLANVEIGRQQLAYWAALRRVVDATPGRLLYAHPSAIYTHLMVDARNPTRYDLVIPGYTTRAQMLEIVAALEKQKVPYVVISPLRPRSRGIDLVADYIQDHYELAKGEPEVGDSLLKRKTEEPGTG